VAISSDKIVTDDVSYIKDNSEFKISRNKLTKNAQVEVGWKIKDDEEYIDWIGGKVTAAPFLINYACALFTASVYDPESLKDLKTENQQQPAEQDAELKNHLQGYTTNNLKINFLDAETSENIATCESTQAGSQNIKFTVNRTYDGMGSMFGSKIGVYEQ
jgi:hypothetical protein